MEGLSPLENLEQANKRWCRLVFWTLAALGGLHSFGLWVVVWIRGHVEIILKELIPGEPLPTATQFILDTSSMHKPVFYVFEVVLLVFLVMIWRGRCGIVWPTIGLIVLSGLASWWVLIAFYLPYIQIHSYLGHP